MTTRLAALRQHELRPPSPRHHHNPEAGRLERKPPRCLELPPWQHLAQERLRLDALQSRHAVQCAADAQVERLRRERDELRRRCEREQLRRREERARRRRDGAEEEDRAAVAAAVVAAAGDCALVGQRGRERAIVPRPEPEIVEVLSWPLPSSVFSPEG
jgi:hypothetical protein